MPADAILPDEERLARLRLARGRGIGPAGFKALIAAHGDATSAIDAMAEGAGRAGRRVQPADRAQAETEIEKAARFGARIVFHGEADYPPALARLTPPPPVLTVMGDATLAKRRALAIVGARNASMAGSRLARSLAEAAGQAGLAVVSGLARGIDAAAHEGSLATGTAGVFAGGLDRPYPPENKPLMRRILDHGGWLISEMPFGWTARAADFPRRNRLVAGLADGLLVVEAALRSGSLISARLAQGMGRPVMAVPGSPLDARAEGPNLLIRQGAILIRDGADLAEALGLDAGLQRRADSLIGLEDVMAGEDGILVDALGTAPVTVDELIAHTGSSAPRIQQLLMELDLAGRLQRHAGGRVSLYR
ncbi:DNA-processing protein DprA [Aureimonas altamirensis]|uniref:DNA-processing protein DprA n=1 Tax=Aureimonas altamirensis TaxID=370622 RepID=UPI002036C28E|nr:DNA-processing protein DprA [Aureimonas altamirensis]MCM2503540.1 DNA-processing protein DprA [Aureimonas altamirensis]